MQALARLQRQRALEPRARAEAVARAVGWVGGRGACWLRPVAEAGASSPVMLQGEASASTRRGGLQGFSGVALNWSWVRILCPWRQCC